MEGCIGEGKFLQREQSASISLKRFLNQRQEKLSNNNKNYDWECVTQGSYRILMIKNLQEAVVIG